MSLSSDGVTGVMEGKVNGNYPMLLFSPASPLAVWFQKRCVNCMNFIENICKTKNVSASITFSSCMKLSIE